MLHVSAAPLRILGRSFASIAELSDRTPVLASFARTPIGRFQGALATQAATRLGAASVRAAVGRAGLSVEAEGSAVDEVLLGNVCAAGLGQAPATQASIYAGLPSTIPTTTVHKVCAAGMKSITLAADSVILGRADIAVAGGFESMSNIPHYLPRLRVGVRLGDAQIIDGLVYDGLTDAYKTVHMGSCAELCASELGFDRAAQDDFAKSSYEKALSSEALKLASEEIVAVEVPVGRGQAATVSSDEEPSAGDYTKMSVLRPAFQKEGTVTAGNSSKLNDGAAAVVVMSAAEAKRRGVKALAAIRGYADAAHTPEWFTTAVALAVPKALARAGISAGDVNLYEINEAFAVVALANMRLLNLDPAIVNVHGGAVALGHPIGASGGRIVGHLAELLRLRGQRFGVAAICNGGGGASAVVLEALG